ncbi:hypothetical protein QQZ08_007419 [Neonectria magnoliae]|uniref:Uncharacterized protein n=1 Tax=Neonectria magnoliae TaxID=2732573 RepID=A0ABR1HZ78_9HYPO
MAHIKIPKDQQEWSKETREHHSDPTTVTISDFGKDALGSASKLGYRDWLHLKIVWPQFRHQPSHDDFFGTNTGPGWRANAHAALSQEDW